MMIKFENIEKKYSSELRPIFNIQSYSYEITFDLLRN